MNDHKYLFIDFNAFFAAVEQFDDPAALGKPLIVAPLASEHTMAIAASYEARNFGINRGTSVKEARQLCPDIIVRQARHDRYVQVHKLLKAEVERYLPISKVYSIDEWVCRLSPSEWGREAALKIGKQVQQGILSNLGPSLRSSIGLAPSRLLAKLAAESHKPDGLTALSSTDLPHQLRNMKLKKIPGIGEGVSRRLEKAGVTDFMGLWQLAPKQARKIWGSVQGERFCYALRGEDVPEEDTQKKSMIGHSRVLSGEHETPANAKIVARALLLKAASRLRFYEMYAGGLSVQIRLRTGSYEKRFKWSRTRQCLLTQDTYRFTQLLDEVWDDFKRDLARLGYYEKKIRLGNVTIFLHRLKKAEAAEVAQGDLFLSDQGRQDNERRHKLWTAIDQINADLEKKMARLGGGVNERPPYARYITLASQHGLDLNYLGAKIAFSRVPEEAEFMF